MTVKTRRRLLVCLVAIAVLLPVETILLRAISTPDSRQAAQDWAEGLDAPGRERAAVEIRDYPFEYRKEIMRVLPPARRSSVWRDHLQSYLDTHRGLDETVVIAIQAAMDAMSVEAFENPSAAARDRIVIVSEQLSDLLGREEAEYLMYRLGPTDGTFASREPVLERLTNLVRRTVLQAFSGDCTCATGWGCDGYSTHCADGTGCDPDESWPMCGWGWSETCDGQCRGGVAG
jgi:hypothetical protein